MTVHVDKPFYSTHNKCFVNKKLIRYLICKISRLHQQYIHDKLKYKMFLQKKNVPILYPNDS